MAYDYFPPSQDQECPNHPGYSAVGHCPRCGQLLCVTCLAAHQQDPAQYCDPWLAYVRQDPARYHPRLPGGELRQPRNPLTTVLWVAAAVLVVCVVALVFAGVAYLRAKPVAPPVEIANSLALPPEVLEPPPSPEMAPASPPPAGPPAALPPSGSAREQAAKAVALQGKPGWVAVINWHQADWSEVRVWIGPSAKDLRLSRTLSWDPALRAYLIVDEGPVPKPPSTTTPPAATRGPQPGEEAALDAALANDPGYVATVVKHSPDWKQATVYTGPPLKPLTNEYRFHWDDGLKQYVLDYMGPIGKGGQPQGE